MDRILVCLCGECAHWEILHKADGAHVMKCKTCAEEYPITIHIPVRDRLAWVEAKDVKDTPNVPGWSAILFKAR
jgi:hypothetical protein